MPTLTVVRRDALEALDESTQTFREMVAGKRTELEVAAWPVKAEAAKAILAGTADAEQQAMIDAEAQGRGVDVRSLAQSIVAKSVAFATASGTIDGHSATAWRKISEAKTEEAIQEALVNYEETIKALLSASPEQ